LLALSFCLFSSPLSGLSPTERVALEAFLNRYQQIEQQLTSDNEKSAESLAKSNEQVNELLTQVESLRKQSRTLTNANSLLQAALMDYDSSTRTLQRSYSAIEAGLWIGIPTALGVGLLLGFFLTSK